MQNLIVFWNFLSGKKTYIVATLTVILGLINGDNQTTLAGLGMFTLRHAISTSVTPPAQS